VVVSVPPVYALAFGALLVASSTLVPWSLAGLGLAAFLTKPGRWALLAGGLVVAIGLLVHRNPWPADYGQPVVLTGQLQNGFLRTERGVVWVKRYPRPPDGWVRVAGTLKPPSPPKNPGGFDERTWLRGLGIFAVIKAREITQLEPPGPSLRKRLEGALTRELSPEVGALAAAIVLGDRQRLGDLQATFQAAGLAHLLALSGLHVGILAGFLTLLLFPLGRYRYPVVAVLLLGYWQLALASPSLTRATLMAVTIFALLFLGRGRLPLGQALALALTVQLALNPYAMASLSFQLSYLALAGLGLFLPLILNRPLPLRPLWVAPATTLAAISLSVPLILDRFHALPLLSPLANLLAIPLVTIFVPLGMAKAAGLAGIAPALEVTGQALIAVARRFAQGPALTWGEVSPAGYLLYYTALAALYAWMRGRLRPSMALALILFSALFSLLPTRLPELDLWQLDVGEGHATLLRFPGGVEALVDTGAPWAASRVIRALDALGIDDLDLLVLTHPDQDHAGAAPEILSSKAVGALAVSVFYPEDDPAIRLARERGIPVLRLAYGDVLELGPARISVWNPRAVTPRSDNARSLVLLFSWRTRRVMVLGDLPARYEDGLPQLPLDVLVASHHGAENGTGPLLLERTRPRVVLIGVGPNRFGHPSPSTLERLQKTQAAVYRTDASGAIEVRMAP